jgi:adenylate kinase family enzyme
MNKIILITGVSGSGKTIVAKYLTEQYKIFHFDDMGVLPAKFLEMIVGKIVFIR